MEERQEEAGFSGRGGDAGRGDGGAGGYAKDRDPPPAYSGEDPETSFRSFEKGVKLWEYS